MKLKINLVALFGRKASQRQKEEEYEGIDKEEATPEACDSFVHLFWCRRAKA